MNQKLKISFKMKKKRKKTQKLQLKQPGRPFKLGTWAVGWYMEIRSTQSQPNQRTQPTCHYGLMIYMFYYSFACLDPRAKN